jgi:hypothetical protein
MQLVEKLFYLSQPRTVRNRRSHTLFKTWPSIEANTYQLAYNDASFKG